MEEDATEVQRLSLEVQKQKQEIEDLRSAIHLNLQNINELIRANDKASSELGEVIAIVTTFARNSTEHVKTTHQRLARLERVLFHTDECKGN